MEDELILQAQLVEVSPGRTRGMVPMAGIAPDGPRSAGRKPPTPLHHIGISAQPIRDTQRASGFYGLPDPQEPNASTTEKTEQDFLFGSFTFILYIT